MISASCTAPSRRKDSPATVELRDMRIALAVVALLAAALCYGLLATAVVGKIRKFGDVGLAMQAIVGVWPNVHWVDVALIAVLLCLGIGLTCVGLALLKRPYDPTRPGG
jgi:hypothetical protein